MEHNFNGYTYVLRLSNMTAHVRILSDVKVSGISKMAACNRKWIYIPQMYHKPWRGRVIGLVQL